LLGALCVLGEIQLCPVLILQDFEIRISRLLASMLRTRAHWFGITEGDTMRIHLLCSLAATLVASQGWLAAAENLGRDLITEQTADGEISGWESFHEQPGTKTGDVWTLDAEGVLVCKGLPKGYLYTKKDFTDVTMRFEWRWPPGGKPGNGGLLLRVTGEHKVWPKSLEVQLNNGQAGDFWGLVNYPLAGPEARTEFIDHKDFGKLTHVTHAKAMEKPAGEWNECEVVLKGGNIRVKINGEPVNQATDCEISPGKIVFTAEGQEIHFRNVRLIGGGNH
jgi:hypothetical protein